MKNSARQTTPSHPAAQVVRGGIPASTPSAPAFPAGLTCTYRSSSAFSTQSPLRACRMRYGSRVCCFVGTANMVPRTRNVSLSGASQTAACLGLHTSRRPANHQPVDHTKQGMVWMAETRSRLPYKDTLALPSSSSFFLPSSSTQTQLQSQTKLTQPTSSIQYEVLHPRSRRCRLGHPRCQRLRFQVRFRHGAQLLQPPGQHQVR